MTEKIQQRPRYRRSGELAYLLPNSYLRARHELMLTVSLITHRYLFGLIYGGLDPSHFGAMQPGSGVFVSPIVPMNILNDGIKKPGDIDLLVVPYDGDTLLLERTMAIEVKAIRSTYLNQGKSPNSMGMSQAEGLIYAGFPLVGVVHLIVSDESPVEAWRPMGVFRVLDEFGNCEALPDMNVDCMPMDLMSRAMGKLAAVRQNIDIGLVTAYLGSSDVDLGVGSDAKRRGTWHPDVLPARLSNRADQAVLQRVYSLLNQAPNAFMDIPRFDPPR